MEDPDTARKRPALRLVDGDQGSLARRVDLALATLPAGARVDHFTYWYTGRPPLHEAAISPPTAGGAAGTPPPSAAAQG